MSPFFCIRNHSTLPEATVRLMCEAVNIQLRDHVAPGWSRLSSSVVYYPEGIDPPACVRPWVIALFDNPDDPNALGYHGLTPDGLPYGRVFVRPVLDNGGAILFGKADIVTVASVLSHEVIEAWLDPFINAWADGPGGTSFPVEGCDAVQGFSYTVTASNIQVSVSDFILPAWLDIAAPTGEPVDYLRKLSMPFEIGAGGYSVMRRTDGKTDVVFGRIPPAGWLWDTKRLSPSSRTSRRAAR